MKPLPSLRAWAVLLLAPLAHGLSAQPDAGGTAPVLPDAIGERSTDDLPRIRERRMLRALVTFSKTDFFLSKQGARGLQAELLHQYEKSLNKDNGKEKLKVHVVYIPVPFNRLIPALLEGEGDVAASFLTLTPEREKQVAFATGGRMRVDEVVVAGKDVKGLETVEDLSGRSVYVVRGSSYVEHLRELNERLTGAGRKPVRIQEADPHLVTEDVLELVNAGIAELTVCDDFKARLWAKVLPNIAVYEDIKVHSGGSVGWAVRKNNPELLKSLNGFMQTVKRGTTLGNVLFNRYFTNTRWVRNPLVEKERKKLEEFWPLFEKYADRYGFDHVALAAQAYQESGLNHNRRSPRGAVGIMQLLPTTARDPNVGIPDISSVESNIHAGTKYLAFLRDRYFSAPEFSDEDRLAFSWAAYNAGPARVRRMRNRARAMGLDPNKWFDNVEYAALRLVGQETVRYVANTYKYYVVYALANDIMIKKAAELRTKTNEGA